MELSEQNENEMVRLSNQLVEAAFGIKDLLSNHKNAMKWETYFGNDKDHKDYCLKVEIQQVVFNHDKTEIKHTVPARLKDNIN